MSKHYSIVTATATYNAVWNTDRHHFLETVSRKLVPGADLTKVLSDILCQEREYTNWLTWGEGGGEGGREGGREGGGENLP